MGLKERGRLGHPTATFVPSIFICYRRDDALPYAGRLHDRLVGAFGRDGIFMDIDALAPGVDFDEEIRKVLSRIDVMLVLIGRQWTNSRDEDGQRRVDNPEDYVRLEIAVALRNGIRVIPVLVGGSRPPTRESLPEEIQSLARRQALELTDTRWEYDTDRLIAALRGITTTDRSPRVQAAVSSSQQSDPRVVGRPVNLGFDGAVVNGIPHGWFNSVGYVSSASDRYQACTVHRGRGTCLKLFHETATLDEFGSMMQRFPAGFLAGRTVQLDGELKTENVTGWAGLWIRADGEHTPNLVFDNMYNRGPRGEQGWARYSLEISLPAETQWLNFGVVLNGPGAVWADDLHLRMWHTDGYWVDV